MLGHQLLDHDEADAGRLPLGLGGNESLGDPRQQRLAHALALI